MKKQLFSVLLVLAILVSLPLQISAASDNTYTATTSNETIYTDDGGYIVVSKYTQDSSCIAASMALTSSTKTGYCDVTKYDSAGGVVWIYTLSATFQLEYGVSVSCTNASYSTTIVGSTWSFRDGGTTISGNYAYGYGVFEQKFLFVVVNTVTIDIRLSCDIYGNIT